MGLSEIRKKLLLKHSKKHKRLNEMLRDLEEILTILNSLSRKLDAFEKKWGGSGELRVLTQENLLNNVLVLRNLSKPSFLDKLTGKYYDYLAMEIIAIPKQINKPILTLSEILLKIKERIPLISQEDLKKAIDILKKKRLISAVFEKDGILYIEFPEIYNDFKNVINYITSKRKRYTTIDEISLALNWDITRTERVLEKMVETGILVEEDYPRRYWLVHI